jgi:hypothetical protein
MNRALPMNADLVAQQAMDRLAHEGFDALTEREKTVACVWLFAAGVGNGGFAGFYAGRRGDVAFHAPTALRGMGAPRLAQLADEANALFGSGGPPRERDARKRVLKAMPEARRAAFTALDKQYLECEEDIDELLEAYLDPNRVSS